MKFYNYSNNLDDHPILSYESSFFSIIKDIFRTMVVLSFIFFVVTSYGKKNILKREKKIYKNLFFFLSY